MTSEIQRKDICFKSSNGVSIVSGAIYTHSMVPPKAIVQISHGMCEHVERYHEFISFLAANGYAVAAHDHLGHGKTAGSPDNYGFFAEENGAKCVLQDLQQMNTIVHQQFPHLPVFLLGHSMGSKAFLCSISQKYCRVAPQWHSRPNCRRRCRYFIDRVFVQNKRAKIYFRCCK